MSEDISTISRRVRAKLGLTQQEFAAALGLKSGNTSIGNWETGRKRPHPRHLQKMAELAPSFGAEIARIVEKYEWHQGRTTGAVAKNDLNGVLELLEEGRWDAIRDIAKKERKTVAEVCAELIESGLNAKVEEMAARLRSSDRTRRSKVS